MWTPRRQSSGGGGGGGGSLFWWKKSDKKKKKDRDVNNFTYLPDDEHITLSGTGENTSPLVRRRFMHSPLPEIKSPAGVRFLSRRPSSDTSRQQRRLIGTIYGRRRGRAIFALQENPSSEPLLLELAIATGHLVAEMAAGPVRILLECQQQQQTMTPTRKKKIGLWPLSPAPRSQLSATATLWEEPVWTMFCNGVRSGYAVSLRCGELDLQVLSSIKMLCTGAGVLSKMLAGAGEDDDSSEMMYMRARFERVVENRSSEVLYMVNPDGGSRKGSELSIFLLRL